MLLPMQRGQMSWYFCFYFFFFTWAWFPPENPVLCNILPVHPHLHRPSLAQIWPHSLCCSNASRPSSPVLGSTCAFLCHLFHFAYAKSSFWLTSWTSVWIPVRTARETALTHGSVLTVGCLFQRWTSHQGHQEHPGTLRRSTRSPDFPLTGIWSLW